MNSMQPEDGSGEYVVVTTYYPLVLLVAAVIVGWLAFMALGATHPILRWLAAVLAGVAAVWIIEAVRRSTR